MEVEISEDEMPALSGKSANSKKLGGRPKGQQNYANIGLRNWILLALKKAGGVDYLAKVAIEQPHLFCALLHRILPAPPAESSDERADGSAVAQASSAQLREAYRVLKMQPPNTTKQALIDILPAGTELPTDVYLRRSRRTGNNSGPVPAGGRELMLVEPIAPARKKRGRPPKIRPLTRATGNAKMVEAAGKLAEAGGMGAAPGGGGAINRGAVAGGPTPPPQQPTSHFLAESPDRTFLSPPSEVSPTPSGILSSDSAPNSEDGSDLL